MRNTLRVTAQSQTVAIDMKKTLQYFCFFSLCCLLAFNLEAQTEKTRVLSYSQLFAKMSASKVDFVLTNARIEFNPTTDQRFLEADSLQLEQFDTIRITCKVFLDKVFFQNTSDTLIKETGKFLGDISLQKIVFTDRVQFRDCKIEIESMRHCSFISWFEFIRCNFPNGFSLNNCTAEADFSFWGCQSKKDLRIQNSKLYGQTQIVMLELSKSILHINNCMLNELSIRWADAHRIIFKDNEINSYVDFSSNKIETFEVSSNHFAPQELDSSNALTPLFNSSSDVIDKFYWGKNTYDIKESYQPSFSFISCKVSDKLLLHSTNFPSPIQLADINITGSFDFGMDCTFEEGVFLYNLFFNERSSINWDALENNIVVADIEGKRQYPEFLDSLEEYGLLKSELSNKYYCEEQLKNKRIFQSVFRAQGSSRKANAVLVEIKDLETAMWEHAFLEDKTLNSYFNWKMNTFLKRFSAYGTNPVIAIIYSLKVILLFALFYLFLHNDWDLNSRKKVGKRLAFMLKYLQVDKGLSELDREEQKDAKDSLNQLHTSNEKSEGKVPVFLRKAIRWYVKSNLLSNNIRNFTLRKMDILSGTYSALSKAKRTKVAFLSGLWLLIFLAYTLLVKVLNALTLSLNAFTTLGFGNIPTRGFSRYIVIVQGFIGWVLMTVFSVTLISQLLQ